MAALCRRTEVRLVGLITVLPAVLFGLPAAFGLPWLAGDNLIQNYPLRVLVGRDLRHGHLPLWDPYLWSGAPLLAGFNAGAAYPMTWLFSVVPAALAWAANQAAVEIVAAAGMLVLLRCLGRSWAAAGLAAATFTYGGFLAGQSVHIDVVQAGAWLPWAFAALDRLANRQDGRPATPWVAMLAVSLGLMILTGAAEPILDGGLVLLVYTGWLVAHHPGRRVAIAATAAFGALLGALLGAAQLVPGVAFQTHSQRAAQSFAYFTSGSMNKSLTLLGLDPMLLGTAHNLPISYLGTYNLPEVSSYIGIMPIMGVLGLLASRYRRSEHAPQLRIWWVVLILGLLLAWGSFTPLGHVLAHLPLYNRQRLLARNLLEVDLAAAVLFAFWLDLAMLRSDRPTVRPQLWRRWPAGIVLALVAPVAVVALQVVLLAGGTWLPHLMHVPRRHITRHSLVPLVALAGVPSALSVAAAAILLARRRLGRYLVAALVVLTVADLGTFNAMDQQYPETGTAVQAQAAPAVALAAAVASAGTGAAGGSHRVGFFDPDGFDPVELGSIGQPDLTVLRRIGSVQGYGALAAERYDRATGTHQQTSLSPTALAAGTFEPLDLGVLVTVPQYMMHQVVPPTSHRPTKTPGGIPAVLADPSAPPDRTPAPPTPRRSFSRLAGPPPPTMSIAAGGTATRFFGTVLDVTEVAVPSPVDSIGAFRLGLLSPDGQRTTWLAPPTAGSASGAPDAEAAVAGGRPASGVVIASTMPPGGSAGLPGAAAVTIGAPVLRTLGQGTFRLDGTLSVALAAAPWRFTGRIGPFAVFEDAKAAGRAWVSSGGTARVVTTTAWGTDTIRVSAPSDATLVRSETYTPGWRATVTPVDASGRPAGPSWTVPVRPHGLVQAVPVPRGRVDVTFRYRPAHLAVAVGTSAGAGAVCAALAVWPFTRRRRRRQDRRPARASAASVSSCRAAWSSVVSRWTWLLGTRPRSERGGGASGAPTDT